MEGDKMQPPAYEEAAVQPTALRPHQSDYLGWSIMNLLCCCWPLGVIALRYSIKTRDANHQNNPDLAADYSRTTKCLNITATVIGVILNIIIIYYYINHSKVTTEYH
ncbi:putative dispanin subfamily A member 2d [Dendropsophus ebraccatus]|uniref:putative dispanin subfamily A member 2d n=1 Tax=Dendropsophus ebraccatus TaxID=150705 RepID=UPI003831339A